MTQGTVQVFRSIWDMGTARMIIMDLPCMLLTLLITARMVLFIIHILIQGLLSIHMVIIIIIMELIRRITATIHHSIIITHPSIIQFRQAITGQAPEPLTWVFITMVQRTEQMPASNKQ